jgi:integrase
MSGTVREAKLESPKARSRLDRGRNYWRTLISGRAHLGYRRWPGKRGEQGGTWFLRRYIARKYRIEGLGLADDVREADGEAVLDFNQAQANGNARLNTPKGNLALMTVRQAMERYIVLKRSQGQPTSDLQSRARAHILPTLGDLVVAELTSEQIRNWLAALADQPAFVRSKQGAPQQHKAPPGDDGAKRRRQSSANRVLSMLKAALNHAFDEGHVSTNKAWGRRVKPFRDVEVARIRYLSVAEAQRLINASDADFRPLVRAALETGCRYGELTRLEVQDFNPDSETLAIRKTKSGKLRHVVLTEEGTEFFRQITVGRPGTELIFRRHDGTAWRASHQSRPMAEACARAKIAPPVGIHQLRHTWASLAVMNGMPLLVVAKNLGHTDTRMVERHYGHMTTSYVADEIRRAAPKFGFKPDGKIVPLEQPKREPGGA